MVKYFGKVGKERTALKADNKLTCCEKLAYFATYDRFNEIRRYTDRYENLFLIYRNSQHRYSNMDHSMLTATTTVDNKNNSIKRRR